MLVQNPRITTDQKNPKYLSMVVPMEPCRVAWRAAPFCYGGMKSRHQSMRMPMLCGRMAGLLGRSVRESGHNIQVEVEPEFGPTDGGEDKKMEPVVCDVAEVQEGASMEIEKEEEAAIRKQLWKGAIKLPMYWVAIVPVLVGGSLVIYQQSSINFQQLGSLLLSAVLIIVWLNLSNDVFDANTGVDQNKKESIVNLTGKPRLILWLSIGMLFIGVGLLVSSMGTLNRAAASCLLGFSIICGYIYQGPPFRLSYKGIGEPLCFIAFGPFATIGFYLAMLQTPATFLDIPPAAWICSTLVGLTTSIVLFCSHFHQYEDDKRAGKLSPIVRLGGAGPGTKVLKYFSSMPYVILCCAVIMGALPPITLLAVLTLSQYVKVNKFAKTNYADVRVIRRLKLLALELHSRFGVVLCCTLAGAGIFAS